MGVYGDAMAVEGGEGAEDGDGEEEAEQGEGEEDQRHDVVEVVEVDIHEVKTRSIIRPTPQ